MCLLATPKPKQNRFSFAELSNEALDQGYVEGTLWIREARPFLEDVSVVLLYVKIQFSCLLLPILLGEGKM